MRITSIKFSNYFFLYLFPFLPFLFSCTHKASDGAKGPADSSITTVGNDDSIKEGHAVLWNINQQASTMRFTITNFGVEVKGTLSGLKGTVHFNEKNLKSSSFETSVDVNTVSTGNSKRDKDLMNEKYFDQVHYPQITFRSDSITKSDSGFIAIGNLTIKGKTMHRKIPFSFERKGNEGIYRSEFSLQRLDYGIGGTGPIMGDEVKVALEVVTRKN